MKTQIISNNNMLRNLDRGTKPLLGTFYNSDYFSQLACVFDIKYYMEALTTKPMDKLHFFQTRRGVSSRHLIS